MSTARVRNPFGPPSHPQSDLGIAKTLRHRVIIKHPGYDDLHNTLLVLQASDSAKGGFHHETARIASAIIADNRWDGFLSKTPTGCEVDIPRDRILPPGEYYFQVPSSGSDSQLAIGCVESVRLILCVRTSGSLIRTNTSSLPDCTSI